MKHSRPREAHAITCFFICITCEMRLDWFNIKLCTESVCNKLKTVRATCCAEENEPRSTISRSNLVEKNGGSHCIYSAAVLSPLALPRVREALRGFSRTGQRPREHVCEKVLL